MITNAITKYENVEFYIWLTKDDKDFRSETKSLTFKENKDPNGEMTDEEINGINKVVNILESEITKVTELEQELNTLISDIQNKLDNGEFKGEKGDSGIVAFEIRNGNLIAISENSENVNNFKIQDGNMILTI